MELLVKGARTYCYSGGKALDAAKPTVVFIHGVLNDHSVWILQTRYFAHHGWNVLAVDLPGHCKSGGEPPKSVEEAADFIVALLDALQVEKAALVGHSWGSLIALEAAARLKDRVSHLVLVGTAYPMKVSAALLEASLNEPMKALELVNVFHRGFVACDSYAGGDAAMEKVRCPVLFVLGKADAMTPPKAARSLQDKAKDGRTVLVDGGHQMMTEAPDAVLFALKDFLAAA
jgi:pimeloyl-ACP methyl ester carboxylesterase